MADEYIYFDVESFHQFLEFIIGTVQFRVNFRKKKSEFCAIIRTKKSTNTISIIGSWRDCPRGKYNVAK